MLFLSVSIGDKRFLIPAKLVRSVIPSLPLSHGKEAGSESDGWFSLHGDRVPVIDICHKIRGERANTTLSTRIILLNYPFPETGMTLGLLVEGVTETINVDSNFEGRPGQSIDYKGEMLEVLDLNEIIAGTVYRPGISGVDGER